MSTASESKHSTQEIAVASESDACESTEITEEAESNLVNHLYELFTNAQGINMTEAVMSVNESLEKTNKILYKILNVLSQHLSK